MRYRHGLIPTLLACLLGLFAQYAYSATQAIDKNALKNGGDLSFTTVEACNAAKTCNTVIFAQGWINDKASQKFSSLADQLPKNTTIYFNSDGGDLIAGLDLGTLIRAKNFNTKVGSIPQNSGKSVNVNDIKSGRCLSACVLAFIGGVNRQITTADIIGFHGLIKSNGALNRADGGSEADQASTAIATLGKYIQSMGVDRRLTEFMLFAQGDKFQRIPYDTARKLGIDNQAGVMFNTWRLQALDNGALLAADYEKQSNGKFMVVLGISKPTPNQGPTSNLRCVVFIKPVDRPFDNEQLMKALSENASVQLVSPKGQLSGKTLVSNWQRNGDGIQAIIQYPSTEIGTLTQHLQFNLEITGLASKYDLESITSFGTSGLKGALSALEK